jgi:hypothetical protein
MKQVADQITGARAHASPTARRCAHRPGQFCFPAAASAVVGVHRREQDSDDDADAWFADLHAKGRLLPSEDDRLRDRAEAVIRLQRALMAGLLQLVTDALSRRGEELMAALGGYLPCRVLVLDSGGVEEIWCALSSQAVDGTHVRDRLRDVLFAALEDRFPDAANRAHTPHKVLTGLLPGPGQACPGATETSRAIAYGAFGVRAGRA